MKEIWKPVRGYEDRYLVSNLGRVKSLDYLQKNPMSNDMSLHKGVMMKTYIDRDGYVRTGLRDYRKGIKKMFTVHRLVAMSFIPNPKKLPCVNHKDNNKTNNFISNLEWISWYGNIQYKISCGRQIKGEEVNTNKLKEVQVIEIRKIGSKLTQKKIAKKYKVTQSNIGCILRGVTWKYLLK